MYSRVSCASKVETRSNAIRAQAFGESLAGAGAVFPLSDPPGQRRAARNASDSAATSSVDLELPNATVHMGYESKPNFIYRLSPTIRVRGPKPTPQEATPLILRRYDQDTNGRVSETDALQY